MTSKVERVGGSVRRIADGVASMLVVDANEVRCALAPRVDGLGFQLDAPATRTRAAWWLIGQWLTGYAIGALRPEASLSDAEAWFYGTAAPAMYRFAPDFPMEEISRLASPEEVWALLPYLLDPLAPGTRRHLLGSRDQAPDRAARKNEGVFYTPADVARWMAQRTTATTRRWTCLDPACGSGVFLRAALAHQRPAAFVFGTDLTPAAAEMAAFVVLASTIHEWIASPWCGWQSARMRLATLDALSLRPGTELDDVRQRARCQHVNAVEESLRRGEVPPAAAPSRALTALGSLFPSLVEGADVLLSNPPYASLGADFLRKAWAAEFDSFDVAEPTAASNISTLFIEFAWRLTKTQTGRASLVLPLSVAFNGAAPYRSVRKAMAAQNGRWECSFFDRAPDSLFGDDVKTRNAVLTYKAGYSGLAVTGLLRWTSRSRQTFFDTIQPVDVRGGIATGIPRVGTSAEAELLRKLREQPGFLAHDVIRAARLPPTGEMATAWSDTVFVGPTAYNWFNCLRDLRPCVDAGHDSGGGFHALQFSDPRTADAAYALLASRVVFWLWRAEGDAFHVGRSFLIRLPVHLGQFPEDSVAELARLGRELWARSLRNPVVATNKQRRTVAYPAAQHGDLLSRVDCALANTLSLVDEVAAANLADWYRTLVVVDEGEQRRSRMSSLRGVEC